MGITLFEDLPVGSEYPYSVLKTGFLDITDNLYLGGDTTVEVSLEQVTSAWPAASEQVRLFPMPADHLLTIESQVPMAGISIIDMTGKLVYENRISKDLLHINLEGWNEGIYLVRIYMQEGKQILKTMHIIR